MKLVDYIKDTGISFSKFGKRIGVSGATIHNIIYKDKDIRLSTAIAIEDETKGRVKCRELVSLKRAKAKQQKIESLNAQKN